MGAKERGRRRRPASEPLRVFLSHTSDLADFPKDRSFVAAAQSAVLRAGHAVTDMAYFTARDNEPADYCEGMVANASVYVAVVGLRYGTLVRGRPDRSYTELEYDAASKLGLPRLIFMTRDETALPPVSQPDEHTARQQAFRQRLLDESNVTVAWIATPAELEIGLFQALVELEYEPSGPRYPNRLRQLRRHWMLTQEEVAERTGVSTSTYQSWERGESRPRPPNFCALCETFGVDEPGLGFDETSEAEPDREVVAPTVLDLTPPVRIATPGGSWGTIPEPPAAIQASQDEWRQARRRLAANGAALTRLASELYPHAMKVPTTPLLTR